MHWDCGEGVGVEFVDCEKNRIYCIVMNCADNRFNVKFCTSLSTALDKISADIKINQDKSFAMIIRGAGKYFSNGLDLKYLLKLPNPHSFLLETYQPIICRFLTLGIPTIAVLTGHAFAGGFVLAMAQDYRISSPNNRSLFCMNELQIRAAIPAGMMGVLKAKMSSPAALRDCMFARRWNVEDAAFDGIIDHIVLPDDILSFAQSKAIPYSQVDVLNGIKTEAFREAVALLTDPALNAHDPFRFVLNNKL